jgi:predicted nucleic acid-binding protein
MRYLLDTGILLRLVHATDPQHQDVVDALDLLKSRGDTFYCGMQNVVEFWNVTTRPATARGGLGLTTQEAQRRLAIIELAVEVLTDSAASYAEWKRLVVAHSVLGVQVHDTKLVALMNAEGLTHLLTLSPSDFKRYAPLATTTPKDVLHSTTSPPRPQHSAPTVTMIFGNEAIRRLRQSSLPTLSLPRPISADKMLAYGCSMLFVIEGRYLVKPINNPWA